MARSGWTVRRWLFGAGLAVAVAAGVTACGSSAKTTPPAAPTQAPAGATNAPVTTSPATTVPSGGGVSY